MKLLIAEEDVGLHAAEPLLKRVEKGTFVEVVVVSVGPGQGGRAPVRGEKSALVSAGGQREQGNQEEERNKGISHAMEG